MKFLPFAVTGTELEDIMLSEISQAQKGSLHAFFFFFYFYAVVEMLDSWK
jgi:hypothetical protein